jgi:D-beta-D-heptose 7-phosphate kinase/D-beta-D-heptose 1-phosphate adenosyltransferase
MNTQVQKKFKVLLIGDTCIDVYQYGTVDRISPEAPVPVFKLSHEERKAGMAGNVRNNLEALGCEVIFLHGKESIKTRLIDTRSKQQIVRIDEDVISTPLEFKNIDFSFFKELDAVIISDYNKGFVDYTIIQYLLTAITPKPIFIDTKKKDLAKFEGAFVKINQLEKSLSTSSCTDVIVTLGDKGAVYRGTVFPAKEVEVADVTGAGDTFISALAYWYINSKDIAQSIQFAIQASSVTVQHIGVHAPTLKEIE